MKKTIQSLFALAVAAFAFTACSDVPEPEGYNPKTGDGLVTYVPEGTGVATDPYNVAGIVDATKDLSKGETTTNDIYTKGYVSEITDFDASYGNISYSITDNAEGKSKKFIVYRGLALGNTKFAAKEDLKVGDEVIICGKVTNYKGTIEYAQGNYLVSLNGKTTGGGDVTPGEAKGDGTEANPFNVAAAVAKCNEVGTTASTDKFYVKGIANAEYTVDNYKNITVDLVDSEGASEKFTVYRCKAADSKNIKEGYKIEKGAEIVVYGPVVNYKGNTPETATGAYVVSVNGQAPEVEGASGGESGGGESGGGEVLEALVNGDFETWADGLPTGWKSASTASSATLEQSTDAHGGSFAVLVKGDASQNKRLATQEITLAAGDYTFSFWVKPTTEDVAQVRPGYTPVTDGKAGNYAYGDYATLTAGWQQVSYNFTLAAETTVCLIVMNPKASSYSSGKDVLVDDATLTKK